jgi:ribosomal protein L37AE/L43A
MRRRKHRKDHPRNAKRCPFCGSIVRRTAVDRWDCFGCNTFWPLVGSNPGRAMREVETSCTTHWVPHGPLPTACAASDMVIFCGG